eukprot:10675945-Karenia_brevis.AAC.1
MMSEDSGGHASRGSQCKPIRISAEDDCKDFQCRHVHHPDHLPQPKTLADLGGGNHHKMKRIPGVPT